MENKGNACQSEVEIRRPTGSYSVYAHQKQPERIGKRQVLIGEFAQELGGTGLLVEAGRDVWKGRHLFDHGEKMERSRSVVPPQKPSVTFCHDQRAAEEPRWL